ncbi:unnamed protein product [Amoebophrya sp. A120]|nr:unnamed protein product [Amoebophrya sp. A120]|eukprot:GSA120T00009946001.1
MISSASSSIISSKKAKFQLTHLITSPKLRVGLESTLGVKRLLPLQEKIFFRLCRGKSLLLASPANSGKTLGCLLPVLERLRLQNKGGGGSSFLTNNNKGNIRGGAPPPDVVVAGNTSRPCFLDPAPQVLVLVPSRQVAKEIHSLISGLTGVAKVGQSAASSSAIGAGGACTSSRGPYKTAVLHEGQEEEVPQRPSSNRRGGHGTASALLNIDEVNGANILITTLGRAQWLFRRIAHDNYALARSRASARSRHDYQKRGKKSASASEYCAGGDHEWDTTSPQAARAPGSAASTSLASFTRNLQTVFIDDCDYSETSLAYVKSLQFVLERLFVHQGGGRRTQTAGSSQLIFASSTLQVPQAIQEMVFQMFQTQFYCAATGEVHHARGTCADAGARPGFKTVRGGSFVEVEEEDHLVLNEESVVEHKDVVLSSTSARNKATAGRCSAATPASFGERKITGAASVFGPGSTAYSAGGAGSPDLESADSPLHSEAGRDENWSQGQERYLDVEDTSDASTASSFGEHDEQSSLVSAANCTLEDFRTRIDHRFLMLPHTTSCSNSGATNGSLTSDKNKKKARAISSQCDYAERAQVLARLLEVVLQHQSGAWGDEGAGASADGAKGDEVDAYDYHTKNNFGKSKKCLVFARTPEECETLCSHPLLQQQRQHGGSKNYAPKLRVKALLPMKELAGNQDHGEHVSFFGEQNRKASSSLLHHSLARRQQILSQFFHLRANELDHAAGGEDLIMSSSEDDDGLTSTTTKPGSVGLAIQRPRYNNMNNRIQVLITTEAVMRTVKLAPEEILGPHGSSSEELTLISFQPPRDLNVYANRCQYLLAAGSCLSSSAAGTMNGGGVLETVPADVLGATQLPPPAGAGGAPSSPLFSAGRSIVLCTTDQRRAILKSFDLPTSKSGAWSKTSPPGTSDNDSTRGGQQFALCTNPWEAAFREFKLPVISNSGGWSERAEMGTGNRNGTNSNDFSQHSGCSGFLELPATSAAPATLTQSDILLGATLKNIFDEMAAVPEERVVPVVAEIRRLLAAAVNPDVDDVDVNQEAADSSLSLDQIESVLHGALALLSGSTVRMMGEGEQDNGRFPSPLDLFTDGRGEQPGDQQSLLSMGRSTISNTTSNYSLLQRKKHFQTLHIHDPSCQNLNTMDLVKKWILMHLKNEWLGFVKERRKKQAYMVAAKNYHASSRYKNKLLGHNNLLDKQKMRSDFLEKHVGMMMKASRQTGWILDVSDLCAKRLLTSCSTSATSGVPSFAQRTTSSARSFSTPTSLLVTRIYKLPRLTITRSGRSRSSSLTGSCNRSLSSSGRAGALSALHRGRANSRKSRGTTDHGDQAVERLLLRKRLKRILPWTNWRANKLKAADKRREKKARRVRHDERLKRAAVSR